MDAPMTDAQLVGQLRRRYIKTKEAVALRYGGGRVNVPQEVVLNEMDRRLFGRPLDGEE